MHQLVDSATVTYTSAGDTDDSTLEVSGNKLRVKDGGITAAKLATAAIPIGVSQTWQNVSSSRLAGTDYTNTTGRPIAVNICVQVDSSADLAEIVVDSITVARANTSSASGALNREQITMSAIVPNNAMYRLTSNGAGRLLWAELR
jgi:membrane-bound inhibitor of C-type lysozyme